MLLKRHSAAALCAIVIATNAPAEPVVHVRNGAHFRFEGEGEGDWFGNRVFAIGDVNGDGIDDVIVTARRWDDPPQSIHVGKLYVYSGVDGSLLYEIEGESDYGEFAHRIVSIGDITGDERDDFVVSAFTGHFNGEESGRVYVYSGGDQALLRTWTGEAGDRLGYQLCAPGDLNGDGLQDFAFSIPFRDVDARLDVGEVMVCSGATLEPLYSERLTGERANARFGWRIEPGDDVDADGRPDLLISSVSHSEPKHPGIGKGYILSGASGEYIWTALGEHDSERFSERMNIAGDVNLDGHMDVLIGSREFDSGRGRVVLFDGSSGLPLAEWTGANRIEAYGERLEALGDISGDGHPDFLVNAYASDSNGPNSGRVYIYSGADYSTLRIQDGDFENSFFGAAVMAAGDVNDDGHNDYLISAPQYGYDDRHVGRVTLFSGRTGRALYSVIGESAGDQIGEVLLDGGDVNIDGVPDYCLGARRASFDGMAEAGRAYVVLGHRINLGFEPDEELINHGRIKVTGLQPGEAAIFLTSATGVGPGPIVPALGGLRLGLLSPVTRAGQAVAGEFGEISEIVNLSWWNGGPNMFIQAVARRGPDGADSVKSNPITVAVK